MGVGGRWRQVQYCVDVILHSICSKNAWFTLWGVKMIDWQHQWQCAKGTTHFGHFYTHLFWQKYSDEGNVELVTQKGLKWILIFGFLLLEFKWILFSRKNIEKEKIFAVHWFVLDHQKPYAQSIGLVKMHRMEK